MPAVLPPLPDTAALATLLREQLKQERQLIVSAYEKNRRPERLLKAMRQATDKVLIAAWKNFSMPASTTLIAVGGYGRGELFPYSDVDLLILLPHAPDAKQREKLERLVQMLWDLGLEIGHSIRTVDECMTESSADITVQTSLLEARRICGNKTLFETLRERFALAMDSRAYFQAKILELI